MVDVSVNVTGITGTLSGGSVVAKIGSTINIVGFDQLMISLGDLVAEASTVIHVTGLTLHASLKGVYRGWVPVDEPTNVWTKISTGEPLG